MAYYGIANAIIESKHGTTRDGRVTVNYVDLAVAARAKGYGLIKPTYAYREIVRLGGVKIGNSHKGTRFAFTSAALKSVAKEAAQSQPHQSQIIKDQEMHNDIPVKTHQDHPPLGPGDFAHKAIFRTLAGDERLALYCSLRVIGYDQIAAFSATLGEVFTGRVEVILSALEVLESTPFFNTLTDDIEESIGADALTNEYDRRIAECSGLAKDAVMHLRSTSLKFKSTVFSRPVESERTMYEAMIGQRLNRNAAAEEFDRVRRAANTQG